MWSIWSSGIASSVVAPADDDPARRPSISTSVWPRLAPRRSAPDTEPGPPFFTISTPGCRCSSSARLCTPLRRISSPPITVTSASTSAIGCDARAAVTTIGSSVVGRGCALCAWHGTAAAHVHRKRNACDRALEKSGTDIGALRVAPCIPARQWVDEKRGGHRTCRSARPSHERKVRASGGAPAAAATPSALRSPIRHPRHPWTPGRVQAGLRARRSCPPAFPSRRTVARWANLTGLPLRGQPRLSREELWSRGTAFPFHPPRRGPAADTCWPIVAPRSRKPGWTKVGPSPAPAIIRALSMGSAPTDSHAAPGPHALWQRSFSSARSAAR